MCSETDRQHGTCDKESTSKQLRLNVLHDIINNTE